MAFDFKIRNGNTKVYPTDLTTGSYLANGSATENGFYIDWAKSRYLEVYVKHSVWNKDANENFIEDPQSYEPAKESDKYEKPGIYTIEVTNPTTGKEADPVRIYVGKDTTLIDTMRAISNDNNAEYTIEEIVNLIDNEGYTVAANGELIEPQPEIELTEDSSQKDTLSVTDTVSNNDLSSTSLNEEKSNHINNHAYIYIGTGIIVVLILIVISRNNKSKQSGK
ncbi:MAG: hypothetical protein K6C68_05680 [Ruminococcus sp.]|nr:hypothetical protein [Ruminococcus sp.]